MTPLHHIPTACAIFWQKDNHANGRCRHNNEVKKRNPSSAHLVSEPTPNRTEHRPDQRPKKSDEVILRISDDGVGICQSDKQKPEHYGLSTMGERALNLGGTISTGPIRPTGTEVFVRFLPQFFLKKLKSPRPKPKLKEWTAEQISAATYELTHELDDEFGKTSES